MRIKDAIADYKKINNNNVKQMKLVRPMKVERLLVLKLPKEIVAILFEFESSKKNFLPIMIYCKSFDYEMEVKLGEKFPIGEWMQGYGFNLNNNMSYENFCSLIESVFESDKELGKTSRLYTDVL
jgi:hypothetical protein